MHATDGEVTTYFSHMHELENVNLNLYHKHWKSALLGGQKREEKKRKPGPSRRI
jgi:hypothetical protein